MDYYFPQHRCAHLLSSFPSGILLVWLLLIALSLPIQGRGNDMKNADLYTLLGISRTAEHREVVSRFRSLARSLHPDALPAHTTPAQREKARQHFLAISEAYEVLSNPKKRARYDQNFRHFKETPRDREYLQYHLFDAGFEAGVVFSTVELQEMYNRQKMHEESVNESSSYTTTFAILFWSTRVADCVNAGITWKEAAKRMQGVSSVVFGAYQCDQNNSACNGLPIRRVPTVLLFRGAKIIPYLGDTIETQQILEKLSPYVQLPSDGRVTIVHHLGESEHTYFLDVCPFNETGRVSLAMYRSTLIVTHHLPFVSFEYNLCYDCSLETKLALSSIISAFPSIRHDRVLCRSEEEMGGAESEDLDDEVDPLDFPRVCREYGMWQQDHAWTIVALHLNSYFSLIPFTRTERRTFDGKKKKKNSNQRSPTNPLTFSSLHTRSGINVIPYPQKERHRAESYRRFILRNLPLSLRSAIESAKSQPWVAKEVKLQSVEAYIEISMRPSESSGNSNRRDLADTMGLDSLAYLNLLRLVRDSTIPHMATYSRNRAEARIFLTLPNVHPSRWKSSALPQIRIFPFGTKAKAQDPIVVPHRLLSSTYSKLCTYLSQEVEPLRLYQLGPEFSQKVFPESLGDVVKTQKQTRASSRAWFVLFNAGSWCPPCERVRPIWRDFARSMQGRKPRDGGNIRIALVNCDVHVSVCEEQGIDGFPTIIFYQGRSIKRIFDGSKNDVPSLVSFALSSWNNFVRDTTVQELRNRVESRDPRNATMQSTPYLVSFTGGSWCPPCVQMNATFKLLAQRISQSAQNVLVGQVDCDENQFICNRFDVEGVPTIVLFHPQPDVVMVRMPATPDRSINAVVQFLQEHIPDFKLRKSR